MALINKKERLRRQNYSVVLMDVQMPEMDGIKATQLIRQQWPLAEQPHIIALTADALAGSRERYLTAGMDDYISKPVRLGQLIKALKRCPTFDAGKIAPARPVAPVTVHSESNSNALDLSILGQLQAEIDDEDQQILLDLVDVFVEDTPKKLAEMRQSLVDEQYHTLTRMAHSLKSNSAIFGATTLSELCKELEFAAQEGPVKDAAKKIDNIEAEFQRAKDALQAILPQ